MTSNTSVLSPEKMETESIYVPKGYLLTGDGTWTASRSWCSRFEPLPDRFFRLATRWRKWPVDSVHESTMPILHYECCEGSWRSSDEQLGFSLTLALEDICLDGDMTQYMESPVFLGYIGLSCSINLQVKRSNLSLPPISGTTHRYDASVLGLQK